MTVLSMPTLPTQRRFIMCKDKFPALTGGYGSGKTVAFVSKAIVLALTNNGCPGILTEPTYQMLEDTLIPELEEQLGRYKIEYSIKRSAPPSIMLIRYKGTLIGSKIMLRSTENWHKLKGPTVAWVGMDEGAQCPENAWKVLITRMRHKKARLMQGFLTGTPEGFNWVYDNWEDNPLPGHVIFHANTKENIFLPDDYIDTILASHSEEEVKQVVEGQFADTSSGQAYARNFDESVSIINKSPFSANGLPGNKPIPKLPLCLACDFNVLYATWLVLQHDKANRTIYVLDEIYDTNTDTGKLAKEAITRGYLNHPSGVVVYGDPSGGFRKTTGASDLLILEQHGFADQRVQRQAPLVKTRVNTVRALLKDGHGKTHVYIHPGCKRLIADMKRVKWKESNSQNPQLDKSNDQLTHASDAFGYFASYEYPLKRPSTRKPKTVQEMLRGG